MSHPPSPARSNRPEAPRVAGPIIGNYEIGKTIGRGSFGKVKMATFRPTGDKVAVKIINRQYLSASAGIDAKIAREIRILKLFSHPNICRLYDVISTPTDILMVMEHIPGKELYDVIVERGKLTEADARYVFQQILGAIEYWHHYRVVHRDLKPENILLENDLTVKVIDFGLANLMKDGVFLRTSCGSPNYAAPEVISGKLYAGPEIDCWSSGVILFALLCGCLPFDEDTIQRLFARIKSGEFRIPSHVSPDARDLIKRMLTVDPLERITVPQIRDHPWFAINLPRFLRYRPSLFENAQHFDTALYPLVASTCHCTPADVVDALTRHQDDEVPTNQRTIIVSYNVLSDAKRRKNIEDMKKLDQSESGSNTTIVATATAAARELNQGLMLTASPAMELLLDGGNAAKAREAYNSQSFVPPSMHDARALTSGSYRVSTSASPGTFCFAGNPSSYQDKVGTLQHSLASMPKRDPHSSTLGAAGQSPTPGDRITRPSTSNTSSTQLVGSVAKSTKIYDPSEAAVAVENNVGWRVGIMTERNSPSVMLGVFNVLRDLGLEWKCPAPFVVRARLLSEPSTIIQFGLMRLAEKHDQGFVIDFNVAKGNAILGLEMCVRIFDKLVLRLS